MFLTKGLLYFALSSFKLSAYKKTKTKLYPSKIPFKITKSKSILCFCDHIKGFFNSQ